jgi:hypothetical protein
VVEPALELIADAFALTREGGLPPSRTRSGGTPPEPSVSYFLESFKDLVGLGGCPAQMRPGVLIPLVPHPRGRPIRPSRSIWSYQMRDPIFS